MQSEVNSTFYTGMSKDVESRMREHNSGKCKYTKSFKPWKLIYKEEAGSRIQARKLEKYYKSSAGKKKVVKNVGGFPV